jgi:hypothetical protein
MTWGFSETVAMLAQRLTAMGSACWTKRNPGLPASAASRLARVRAFQQPTERPEDRDLPNVASGTTFPLGWPRGKPRKNGSTAQFPPAWDKPLRQHVRLDSMA